MSAQLFLAIAIILLACRLVGALGQRLGQPQVMGEMVAGVLLGPSVLGHLLPELHAQLFTGVRPILATLSQIGLVIYMFVVGLELEIDELKRRYRSAFTISLAGILAPFALGGWLAYVYAHDRALFAPQVSVLEAVMFLGAAMSITAFPVLARILRDKGVTSTRLGMLALTAGSLDDAAAWCLLATVLALSKDAPAIALLAIAGGLLYVVLVLGPGRWVLQRLARAAETRPGPDAARLPVLILLFLGAWFTDAVGIHAVFGAFVMGAAMPRGTLSRDLVRTLEPLTSALLVPLFFAYTGLNTRFDLIVAPGILGFTLLAFLAAFLGKGGACWAVARLNGEGRWESVALGALVNARGLMELILLTIGLERGLITPALFTVMVLMAIVTTLVASPVFDAAQRRAPGAWAVPPAG